MRKEEIIAYEIDASQIKGNAKDVLHPESILQAQKMITENQRLCIRGGGTGLVGGAIPEQHQDIVLDLSKLNKIENIDVNRKTVEVEPGVIPDELEEYLSKFNLKFPIKPTSYNSCTFGGMVATNASDERIHKYGKMENWVRWIEVIDSEGNIDRKGKTEISDYAGMEGITGVICKICLNLIEKHTARSGTLIKLETKEKVVEVVKKAKQITEITMIEFIDKAISEKIGLSEHYHLILEYENETGVLKGEDYEKLLQKHKQIYHALVSEGYTRVEDPKIMLGKFVEVVEWLEKRNLPVYGNISVGILYPHFYEGQEKYIPEFYNMIKKTGGKLSGRHGIGITKKKFVEFNDKKILENIKKRTDPKNKFNIGKVI
jgi:glycolate oxidase